MEPEQLDGPVPSTTDDDVVIDITDEAIARRALYERILSLGERGELVIDLRDAVLDGTEDPSDAPSGRPQSLLPHHRLVRIAPGEAYWDEAEAFVYQHYVELGYTDENPARKVSELQPWADRSRFHAVIDDDETIVGTVRTIYGPFDHLPVAKFERTDDEDPDPVCELSSLVVDHRLRSTGVIEHLYRAGWLDAWRHGSQAVVALIDEWLLTVFRKTYHLPFRQIGLQRRHMGGDLVPVALPLRGDAYLPMARSNPHFWAWTLEALQAREIAGWDLPIVITDEVLAAQEAAAAGAEAAAAVDQTELTPAEAEPAGS